MIRNWSVITMIFALFGSVSCADLEKKESRKEATSEIELGSGNTTDSDDDDDSGGEGTSGQPSSDDDDDGNVGDDSQNQGGSGTGGATDEGNVFDKYKDKFDNFSDEVFAPIQPFERYTAGQGGAAGGVTGTFTDSNGTTSEYRVYVPAAGGTEGVLVYFHGDGQILDFSLVAGSLDAVADDRNMIALVAKAPDGFSWWAEEPFDHAQFTHELLAAEVFTKYNADVENLYFIGRSGGANFIAAFFVPQYGYYYHGTYIALCGGEENRSGRFKTNESFEQNTQMVFVTNQGDSRMIDQTERAVAYYDAKDFPVDSRFPAGTGHCAFDANALIDEFVGKYYVP